MAKIFGFGDLIVGHCGKHQRSKRRRFSRKENEKKYGSWPVDPILASRNNSFFGNARRHLFNKHLHLSTNVGRNIIILKRFKTMHFKNVLANFLAYCLVLHCVQTVLFVDWIQIFLCALGHYTGGLVDWHCIARKQSWRGRWGLGGHAKLALFLFPLVFLKKTKRNFFLKKHKKGIFEIEVSLGNTMFWCPKDLHTPKWAPKKQPVGSGPEKTCFKRWADDTNLAPLVPEV